MKDKLVSKVMSRRPSRGTAEALRLADDKTVSRSATATSTVQFEGWLTKRGGFRGGFRNWKKRWFVLAGDLLSYYETCSSEKSRSSKKTELTEENSGVKLLGVMSLKSAQIVIEDKTTFAVENTDRRLLLQAYSQAEMNEWTEQLQMAIDESQRNKESIIQRATAASIVLDEHKPSSSVVAENQWEIPSSEIVLEEKIASGNYGEIFKGKVWGTTVAIKKLYLVKVFASCAQIHDRNQLLFQKLSWMTSRMKSIFSAK